MKKTFITTSLLGVLSLCVANAATITWTAYKSTGAASEVLNIGTTTTAINGHSNGGTFTTNGVTFTNSDATLGSTAIDTNFTDFTSADPGYQTLISSVDFGPNAASTLTINFTGLLQNRDYAIQYWYMANSLNAGNPQTRTMTLTASGTATTGTGDVVLSAVGQGVDKQYAIGTFNTGTDTTQSFTVISGANGVRMTAYQLRLIPEPSSAALLGLGLVALVTRRRRVS